MTGKLMITFAVQAALLSTTLFLLPSCVISLAVIPAPAGTDPPTKDLPVSLLSTTGGAELLSAAETAPKVIKVSLDGSGQFKSVIDAVKSIPTNNKVRTILVIGPGEYKEKITVDRFKPFVTFYGSDPKNMPKLVYDGTAAKYGTFDSATVIVESDYFVAVNIIFQNSAPKPTGKQLNGEQAVAMRISGDKAAFHNCRFIGFQDTLCDAKGTHFFNNSYIEGTVDFIFGNGKSLYLRTEIRSVADGFSALTASMRDNNNDDSGFSFVNCNISGTGDIYLSRTWKEKAVVVFAQTYMGMNVNPAGWFNNKAHLSNKDVFYGEYKCMGPGSSTGKRATFAKMLTDAEAKPYLDHSYINASTWLLPPPKI
ncbi:pectinesterase [Ranunculus cassubicifolius]